MYNGNNIRFTHSPFFLLAGILLLGVVLYLTLPLLALFLRTNLVLLVESFFQKKVQEALFLSLVTTVITTVIILIIGTPAAYIQSRVEYPGKKFVETCIDLPIVLPPAVAGFALLLLYGRVGLLGKYLLLCGIRIPFTTTAVIMAQLFVAAPLYIRHAKSLFAQMDLSYEEAARSLGAGHFRVFKTIALPLTKIGLLSGAILSYARALGEFGATIMFAGNLPGVTQTMPLAIYTAMQSDFNTAVTISILLVMISLVIMFLVRYFGDEKNA